MIATYPDEVAEAIRDLLWDTLREDLGLQRCQQDQREGFPLEQLAARLPAIIVRSGRSPAPVPDLPDVQMRGRWQSWRVDYQVDVIYAQELEQTGEPNRDLMRAAGRIRDLFLDPLVLDDLEPGPGFVLDHVRVGDMDPSSGVLAMDARTMWIGEVVIPITVATVAYPFSEEEVSS